MFGGRASLSGDMTKTEAEVLKDKEDGETTGRGEVYSIEQFNMDCTFLMCRSDSLLLAALWTYLECVAVQHMHSWLLYSFFPLLPSRRQALERQARQLVRNSVHMDSQL